MRSFVAMALVVAGCAKPSPPAAVARPPAKLLGTWVSPSCGARTMERWLSFGVDGKVNGAQVVVPTPPTASVTWQGTYTVDGGRIGLNVDFTGGVDRHVTTPAALDWDEKSLELVEVVAGERCVYRRDGR